MSDPYRSCQVCEFGYCAPARCYCGHPECTAYPSWVAAHPTTKEEES